ncbi:uncharacterized protein [Spinacia oleracea]|uniref:DUF4283 domain-containing protein n=1 Tax=Spinacia oleracea TaxID=3562 RepID=A0ABM3R908_SPIOL|nr:uncharacterized protein LOC110793907 [Spinacia oleracea]
MDRRDEVLASTRPFFDSKPVVLKPWTQDMDFTKEDLRSVPIWVKLHQLDFKYWGERSLRRIVGRLGVMKHVDNATAKRDKLQFARVQIEVLVEQSFPETIKFINGRKELMEVRVEYEWRPVVCAHCKGVGHDVAKCRKATGKRVWVPRQNNANTSVVNVNTGVVNVNTGGVISRNTGVVIANTGVVNSRSTGEEIDNTDAERFTPVMNSSRRAMSRPLRVNTANQFQVLGGEIDERGVMGDDNQQNEVRALFQSHGAGVVGLLETKVPIAKLGALYINMFSGWCFTSNSSKCKGGELLWLGIPTLPNLTVLGMSSQMIHCLVCPGGGGGNEFMCTFIYAFNQHSRIEELWKDLCEIGINCTKPWVVMCDFNCVLNVDERVGSPVRHQEMVDFRNCVNTCGMEDIKAAGHFYTWSNKQAGDARVFSKIDRVMANDVWVQLFPSAVAEFLSEGMFDHCPMVVSVYPTHNAKRPFRYFDMWKMAEGYEDLVASNWKKDDAGALMYKVVQKLKRLNGAFRKLNKEGFNDIHVADLKAFNELQQCQKELHDQPGDRGLADKEADAASKYRVTHAAYLSYLRQKAKERWIKEGDENSALFHKSIRARVMHNSVYSIHDMHGQWVNQATAVNDAFLLGSASAHRSQIMLDIVNVGPVLDQTQGQQLVMAFTGEEVKSAMFSIDGDKAPGPDGFGSHFFKEN